MQKINNMVVFGEVDENELKEMKSIMFEYSAKDKMFVYYHDVDKDTKVVRIINAEKVKETVEAMEKVGNIVDALTPVVNNNVHPEDREKVINAFKPEYYLEALKDKKCENIFYRWKSEDGSYYYTKLEIFKKGDPKGEPKHVIIGCINVDDEYREAIEKKETEKRYASGIYALSREYTSVYYVNLDNGELMPYNLSNRISGMFGDEFYKQDYFNASNSYVENAVFEEEKEKMYNILSPSYIKANLQSRESFTRVYRTNNGKYCEMKCVKIKDETGAFIVVMGFAEKDEEIRKQQEQRTRTEFQISLLEGLSLEYTSVWLVHPDKKLELYRSNVSKQEVLHDLTQMNGKDMDEAFGTYIDLFVAVEDKERIHKDCSYEALMATVQDTKPHTTTFKRINREGIARYMQARIIKVNTPDGETFLVLGFKDVDEMIRFQLNQQEKYAKVLKERDHDVITGLFNRLCYEKRILSYDKMDAKSITCIYMDVDGLHEVNNKEGHEAGDIMLKTIAGHIKETWGEYHSYRIGGDEFVIFVFNKSEAIIDEEIKLFHYNIMKAGYSVSLGQATHDLENLRIQQLIRTAEAEMFKAKKEHYSGSLDRRRNDE